MKKTQNKKENTRTEKGTESASRVNKYVEKEKTENTKVKKGEMITQKGT